MSPSGPGGIPDAGQRDVLRRDQSGRRLLRRTIPECGGILELRGGFDADAFEDEIRQRAGGASRAIVVGDRA